MTAEMPWFYHVTYQYPIANSSGTPLGYGYGDTTYRTAWRIDDDAEFRHLRDVITSLADENHATERHVRRAGKPVIMSITLLASPEDGGR